MDEEKFNFVKNVNFYMLSSALNRKKINLSGKKCFYIQQGSHLQNILVLKSVMESQWFYHFWAVSFYVSNPGLPGQRYSEYNGIFKIWLLCFTKAEN